MLAGRHEHWQLAEKHRKSSAEVEKVGRETEELAVGR